MQEREVYVRKAAIDVVCLFRREGDRTMSVRMVALDDDLVQFIDAVRFVADRPHFRTAGAQGMFVVAWQLFDSEVVDAGVVSAKKRGDDIRETTVNVE